MFQFVGFDNDLPTCPLVLGLDHEPPLDDVYPVTTGVLEHEPEIDLAKVAILHALLEVANPGESTSSPGSTA
jgi:hypothetical protein